MFPTPIAVKYSSPNKLVAPALNVDLNEGTFRLICASKVW